jgi:hypothetical protein
MGRDSKNEGGLLIGVHVIFDLRHRFCGPHSLESGMGVQLESNV